LSAFRTRRRGVIEPTIFALVGIAILIGLGIWQLDRKAWKENLIATATARLSQTPQDLPPRVDWIHLVQADNEFRRVAFPAEFLPGEEALVYSAGSAFRPDVQGTGYWVFAPARLAGGSIVVVDRGFIPLEAKDVARRAPPPRGIVDIVGVMRWPETRGIFTPADEPQNNIWFLRDPDAMAKAHKWQAVAPFYIEQEAPVPEGGLPKPGKLTVNLPDNHLQYAITWFGLALGLAGVTVVFIARRIAGRG
jgi:surfeit locus 1 family protein